MTLVPAEKGATCVDCDAPLAVTDLDEREHRCPSHPQALDLAFGARTVASVVANSRQSRRNDTAASLDSIISLAFAVGFHTGQVGGLTRPENAYQRQQRAQRAALALCDDLFVFVVKSRP